ncbi:MAG TPA: hypothetical protein VM581_01045 [Magnetospirillaceae bacterium]|nr:hypothetical protein [Magnetospirillaceae bacterium]
MGFIHYFAHEGHSHEIAAGTIPWWQDSWSVSIVLMVGFLSMLIVAQYVFKAKFGLKVVLAMGYLLAVGVLCYAVAPVLSIVSLSTGLAIALITTLLALGTKKQPPQK